MFMNNFNNNCSDYFFLLSFFDHVFNNRQIKTEIRSRYNFCGPIYYVGGKIKMHKIINSKTEISVIYNILFLCSKYDIMKISNFHLNESKSSHFSLELNKCLILFF